MDPDAAINENDDSNDSRRIASNDEEEEEEEDDQQEMALGEYYVKQVLAENWIDGELKYLIEWEGWPLLASTWEPFENIEGVTYEGWEEDKADKVKASYAKMRYRQWFEESTASVREKIAKLKQDNRAREQKGLPPREMSPTLSLEQSVLDQLPAAEGSETSPERGLRAKEKGQPSTQPSSRGSASTASFESNAILEGQRRSSLGNGGPFGSSSTSRPRPSSGKKPIARTKSSDAILSAAASTKPAAQRWQGTARPGQSSRQRPSHSSGILSLPRPILNHAPAAAPKKTTTAQKPPLHAGFNVFAGGRKERSRPTFLEAASDTSKDPKLVGKRLQWKLEVQGRNREGLRAPGQQPRHMISLDKRNQQDLVRQDPQPSTPAATVSANIEAMEVDAMEIDAREAAAASDFLPLPAAEENQPREKPNAAPEAMMTEEPLPAKPKKRVTWPSDVADPVVSECEESLFVRGDSPDGLEAPETLGPTAIEPVQPQNGHQVLPQWQVIQTMSQIGKGSLQFVNLSLHGVPAAQKVAWVSSLQNETSLAFTHICSARDFQSQQGAVISQSLWGGMVSSLANPVSLRGLSDRLRIGPRGLLCRMACYFLMLVPSRCKDWDFLQIAESAPDAESDVPLKYLVFEPRPFFEDNLAPLEFCHLLTSHQDKGSAVYLRTFEKTFGVRYEKLLPQDVVGDKSHERHSFFLVFPHRSEKEAQVLSRWLAAMHPDCDVRSSLRPGQWIDFQSLEHGVVIIHEDILPHIRSLPNLRVLLRKRGAPFSFWTFTSSLPLGDAQTHPRLGDLRLRAVLKNGVAIMMTPSFFLAQPEQAYEILKFFYKGYPNDDDICRLGRIAVWADIEKWLHDLAMEKTEFRAHLGNHLTEDDLRSMALDDRSLLVRAKTFELCHQIATRVSRGESSLLTFAPETINGSDEQSLVNWFGWWSVENMQEFGNFTIVGSSPASKNRLTRNIPFPNYAPGVLNDPDALDDVPKAPIIPQAPMGDRSSEGEAIEIETELRNFTSSIIQRGFCPIKLFYSPVAHWDPKMGWSHCDIRSRYKTYQEWSEFYQSHKPKIVVKPGNPKLNTLVGFFHTADTKPDPNEEPKAPQRHPWIAILRPVDLFKKPWIANELLIWDPAHKTKLDEGGPFTLSGLSEAQRELVYHLEAPGNLERPLQDVWVGALPGPGPHPSGNPVFTALAWLDQLLDHVKAWIPAISNDLSNKGWIRVQPESAGLEKQHAHPEKGTTLIFPPPRRNSHRTLSRCRNGLYDIAVSEQRKSQGEKTFKYTYRPTAEWYRDQCDEGRGYEHIWVTNWEEFFGDHKIKPVDEQ